MSTLPGFQALRLTFLHEGPHGRGRPADPRLFPYADLQAELRGYGFRNGGAGRHHGGYRAVADVSGRVLSTSWWTEYSDVWKRSWAHVMSAELPGNHNGMLVGVIRVPDPAGGPGVYHLDDMVPPEFRLKWPLNEGGQRRPSPAHVGLEHSTLGAHRVSLYRAETCEVAEIDLAADADGGRRVSPDEVFRHLLRRPAAGGLLDGDVPCIVPMHSAPSSPETDEPIAIALLREPRGLVAIPLSSRGRELVLLWGSDGGREAPRVERYRNGGPPLVNRVARGLTSTIGAAVAPAVILREATALAKQAAGMNPISLDTRALKLDAAARAHHVFQTGWTVEIRAQAGILAADLFLQAGQSEAAASLITNLRRSGAETPQVDRLSRTLAVMPGLGGASGLSGA